MLPSACHTKNAFSNYNKKYSIKMHICKYIKGVISLNLKINVMLQRRRVSIQGI